MSTPPFNISDEMTAAFFAAMLARNPAACDGNLGNDDVRAGLEAVAPLIAVQVLRSQPKVDTDWHGEALDLSVTRGVVSMRRDGAEIKFAVVGDVVRLSPSEADTVATSLASAAELARRSLTEDTP